MSRKTEATQSYDKTISQNGFRFTEQRRQVYDALMGNPDHPTAVEVFMRVKPKMPSISLATVYNTLETLTECGLLKHVNHHREPSRYCPNLAEHAHLFCEGCGSVIDLPLLPRRRIEDICKVPSDVVISHYEVSFRGLCPKCNGGLDGTKKPAPAAAESDKASVTKTPKLPKTRA
jgi:Fe2+ or Zn2+ uptake regulation protein